MLNNAMVGYMRDYLTRKPAKAYNASQVLE